MCTRKVDATLHIGLCLCLVFGIDEPSVALRLAERVKDGFMKDDHKARLSSIRARGGA